jgi:PEGA domain
MRASFLAVTVVGALVSASTLATADNRGGGRSSGHSNSGGGRGGSRQGSSASSRSGHTSEHRAAARDSNRSGATHYSNRGEATRYRAGDGRSSRGYRNSRPSYYRGRSYRGYGSYYRPGFSLYLGSPSYYDSYAYGGYYPETYAAVPYAAAPYPAAPYAPDYGYSAPVEDEQDVRPDADYGDRDGVADAGRLQLDVRPADATIYVDGQFRGTAAVDSALDLAPGRHTVEIVRPGYQTERRVVDVRIGEARSLSIALQPARR